MKGDSEDPELTTINPPIERSNKIIGHSQNFFLTFKKFQNSFKKFITRKWITQFKKNNI